MIISSVVIRKQLMKECLMDKVERLSNNVLEMIHMNTISTEICKKKTLKILTKIGIKLLNKWASITKIKRLVMLSLLTFVVVKVTKMMKDMEMLYLPLK
jgi:hypothetical protein